MVLLSKTERNQGLGRLLLWRWISEGRTDIFFYFRSFSDQLWVVITLILCWIEWANVWYKTVWKINCIVSDFRDVIAGSSHRAGRHRCRVTATYFQNNLDFQMSNKCSHVDTNQFSPLKIVMYLSDWALTNYTPV